MRFKMAISRTNTVLFVVLVMFLVKNNCDSDIKQNNYHMDNVNAAEHLLRGSNDDKIDEDDIAIPNFSFNKNIEPEKNVFSENVDDEQKDNKHYEKDYDESEMQRPAVDKTVDYNPRVTTTESALTIQATTDSSDEIAESADNVKDSDFTRHEAGDLSNLNQRHEESDKIEDANEIIVTSPAPMDATEAATDAYTLSMIDNNVYKLKDSLPEDIYINGSAENYNSEIDSKIEYTSASTTATTRAMDVVEPPTPPPTSDMKETDSSGQRIPKTENSNSKQPKDKRNNENKQPSLPAISRSSTLKGWLEDAWLRPPPGLLVPLRPLALTRALGVWNDLVANEGINVSDIVIVGYDSNGVSWRSRHNLQGASPGHGNKAVSEALSKLLLKYQGVHSETSSDGAMRALASAAKLVPYDSALFVVTDKGAGDPQKLPLALRALVEKRLKVYTIWTDPYYPSIESETDLRDLRNVSRHTEGDVLPYSLQVLDVESLSNSAELQQWQPIEPVSQRQARLYSEPTNDYDTLLVRRGNKGAISQGVPVENGVAALKIYIEGKVDHAVLYPPNDAPLIDLYNVTSIKAFSPSSRTEGTSTREILLVFPGTDTNGQMLSVVPVASGQAEGHLAATVGVWHLTVRCDACEYRLCVSARTQIHFDTNVNKDKLELRITGPVASLREALLVDEYGTELAKLPFSYQPTVGDSHEEDAQLEIDMPLPNFKGGKVYAKIFGRDTRGDPFVRLSGPIHHQSEVRMSRSASISFPEFNDELELVEELNSIAYNNKLQYNDSNILPTNRASSQIVNQQGTILTAVQIGLSTRLYGAPGASLQLHFEVTNYRSQAVNFNFGAVGELRFLRGISPTSQVISAGQTANVIVNVGITSTAQAGARDLITFTAYSGSSEQVSISAYVYVVNLESTVTDVWAPEVRHNFQGTCIGRTGTDCATHVWSATVIARDAVGGLLRISSSPVGLVYDSNFISGSREEVIATYRSTCCAPRVMVTAVDAYGNANSYVMDISTYYSEAAIAAIVLGVLLAIALIALLIFLIYWCVKRRKESRELPYTTTTRSSRNIS